MQDYKKHLNSLGWIFAIFLFITLIAIYFNDFIYKNLFISLLGGVVLYLIEYFFVRYLRFREKFTSIIEMIQTFLFVFTLMVISNRYGIFYLVISLDIYLFLMLIFRNSLIKRLDLIEQNQRL